MTAPLLTAEGDLTAVPHANDNVPAELRALGAAIGKVTQAANDNLPPVVAFTGVAGSGKSTATRYLVEQHGYTLVKFAGPLKDMMRALGLDDRQIEGDLKEIPSDILAGRTPRHAMQTLGTAWGRDCIGEDFWIGLFMRRASIVTNAGGRVVTDDCRFPNEAQAIRRLGGDIFKIEGRGGIAGEHVSEKGCGDQDLVIANGGEVALLHKRVGEALRRYG
ncbi:deoxynucleotide monophosphate kinase [Rhizobium leguminosarum]|uniref:deoxynucleotide monophosphate kinase family protein n=1 Tax=Rhizobium leguminosarum TaxID=384 RepID=UPI000FEC283B|nr:deoxynucleotide monophosphate kinase [Rhizobium leguminosarum]RWX28469.1 deoxynucleotide monophosphate kinase [Rhizobium leguminosarum]